ncbi:MAG TPA: RidA family protein, partial [Candidatus Sulfotelmatobacter sp.]|nr:RidA family protein [Candidatus Sulfotelmatobacter sp.]
MAVMRKFYNPEGLGKRIIDGKLLYSHVVTVRGGTRVILAGQVPRAEDGSVIAPGDMRGQIVATCENIKKGLAAAGATFKDVVRSTTYVTDMQEYFRHVSARIPYFAADPPTSTTVQVSALAHPDFKVEIEVEAVIDEAPPARPAARASARRAHRAPPRRASRPPAARPRR